MIPPRKSSLFSGFLPLAALMLGIFGCSTSVIFIKLSHTDPIYLSAWRQILAALFLSPLFFAALRRHPTWGWRRSFRRTALPAAFLGFHFISWIMGARLTPAANSSLIVNMVPIVMPFMLALLIREHLNRQEITGTVIAMAGVIVLGAADFQYSPEHGLGDLICFASMVLYAAYLAFARKNRDFPEIGLYLVPLYFSGGMICLVLASIGTFAGSGASPLAIPFTRLEGVCVLGLALVPTVVGHSLLNNAMKHFRGQTVAILNLSQFMFAGVMGFFFLREIPSMTFYVASLCVLTGAVIVVRATPLNGSGR